MNRRRIEVPLTLTPPHFDDETTIATARRVVPIERARTVELRRKMRAIFPLLFAATLCGALGATAVNYYYERGQIAPTPAIEQSLPVSTSVPIKPEPSPVAFASSADVSRHDPVSDEKPPVESQHAAAESAIDKEKSAKTDTKAAPANSADAALEATSKTHKTAPESDPAKLIRKRRVQDSDPDTPKSQKNGAARITDIFGAPNP